MNQLHPKPLSIFTYPMHFMAFLLVGKMYIYYKREYVLTRHLIYKNTLDVNIYKHVPCIQPAKSLINTQRFAIFIEKCYWLFVFVDAL